MCADGVTGRPVSGLVPEGPGLTIGSTCFSWLNPHDTTKFAPVGAPPSSWAETTGAFHNISATTQAAAAATPTINMSAKRTCQVRSLLASFLLPSFRRPCSLFAYLPQYQFMALTSPTHGHKT